MTPFEKLAFAAELSGAKRYFWHVSSADKFTVIRGHGWDPRDYPSSTLDELRELAVAHQDVRMAATVNHIEWRHTQLSCPKKLRMAQK